MPTYHYRKHQKSRVEQRLENVVRLAYQLGLSRAVVTGGDRPPPGASAVCARLGDPAHAVSELVGETVHPTLLAARQANAA